MPEASRTLIVTGAAGFIGSALVRHLISETDHHVVSHNALTYAGSRDNLDWCERRLGSEYGLQRLGTASAAPAPEVTP